MKRILILLAFILFSITSHSENNWPKELIGSGWVLNIYQPINESLKGNVVKSRCAVSIKFDNSDEPIFGAMWTESRLQTNRDERTAVLESVKVIGLKFPDSIDSLTLETCKFIVETEVPRWDMEISMDKLLASIEYAEQEVQTADAIKNDPPEIIFKTNPSLLVVIDGDPKYEQLEGFSYQQIVNTPFFMIRDPKAGEFFLYGNEKWFQTRDFTGQWQPVKKMSSELKKLNTKLQESMESPAQDTTNTTPEIVIRMKPAELITTNGDPVFSPIAGTDLLYVSNSSDNIFRLINSQDYYILISGRWFKSATLTGTWTYVEASDLPVEFSKIPEGSDKDGVLASVPGTDAAEEALLDSQIPQTAAVERSSATTSVTYDGNPKFEKIDGTSLYYAKNSSQTVLMTEAKIYYVCDDGVWFTGTTPDGPWEVATQVPPDVQKIPPSSPVYNVKYVYIYESTPTVVYTGYTPGYLGCYPYGPVVVYGTGYNYSGWYGTYYYPRPVTYGFNFHYNPYSGWSMGFSMSYGGPHGWVGMSFGSPYYHGGWWGPPVYHPPYYHHPHSGGYYGPRASHYGNTNVNINRTNNIYVNKNRPGVESGVRPSARPSSSPARPTTKPSGRPSTQPAGRPNRPTTQPSGRPSTQPAGQPNRPSTQPAGRPNQTQPTGRPSTQPAGRPSQPQQQPAGRPSTMPATTGRPNNVYADPSGNIYRNNNNSWEQNNGRNWQPAQQAPQQNLNNMQNSRDRGNVRQQNSTPYTRPQSAPQSRPSPAGRPGGGATPRRR